MNELRILIVDDDVVDVENIERALRRRGIGNPVYRARDGVEALDLLLGREGHQPLGAPRLILLDLNMPRMDGFEFLEELRRHPEHEDDPVFVLTTSDDPRHEAEVQKHGVAGYIVKDELPLRALDLVMQGYRRVPLAQVSTADVTAMLRGLMNRLDELRRFTLELPPSVMLFETATARLETVFRCLVENAIEHHDRAGGKIRVNWEDVDDMVRFRVHDDGPGIPDERRRDVFKPLYTTKPDEVIQPHVGSGMGLPLARQIVTSAGGTITIEPAVSRGTTVTFTWPLEWPEPEEVPSLSLLPMDDEEDLDPQSVETVEDFSEPHERVSAAHQPVDPGALADVPEPSGLAPREEVTGGIVARPPADFDADSLDAALAAAIEDATSELEVAEPPDATELPERIGMPPALEFTRTGDISVTPVPSGPPPAAAALPPASDEALAAFEEQPAGPSPAATQPAQAGPVPAASDALAAFAAAEQRPAAVEESPSAGLEISAAALAAFQQQPEPGPRPPAVSEALPFVVLLVDDDEIDAEALDRAMTRRGHAEQLLHAADVDGALHLLRGAGGKTTLGPVVMLLDLSLPGRSGFDLLQELRADDDLCGTPVFVLSGSHDPMHRAAAMRLGAAGFIDKDKVAPGYLALVDLLEAYGKVVSF